MSFSSNQRLLLGALFAGSVCNQLYFTSFDLILGASYNVLSSNGITLNGLSVENFLAFGSGGYFLGKVCTALGLVDKITGLKSLCVSLLFSSACGIALITGSPLTIAFAWLLSRFSCALYAPALGNTVRVYFYTSPNVFSKAWGIISTAGKVGSVFGNMIWGMLLSQDISWRYVMFLAILFEIGASWCLIFAARRQITSLDAQLPSIINNNKEEDFSWFYVIIALFSSLRFWLILIGETCLIVLLNTSFFPLFLQAQTSMDISYTAQVFNNSINHHSCYVYFALFQKMCAML